MNSVPTKEVLLSLQTGKENEIIHVEDLNQDYIYSNKEWIPYYSEEPKKENFNPKLTLYQMNKMLIQNIPDLTKEEIDIAKKNIRNFIKKTKSNFYMLLSDELRYYTLFLIDENSQEKIEDIVVECIENFGAIKSVETKQEPDCLEIWFTYENEVYVAYLFNYEEGVVICQ